MSTRRVIVAIEEMKPEDWVAVRAIYLQGIATGDATFETSAPAWEQWDAGHLDRCRFVARLDGEVVGWIALSPVSRRQVYAGVAEVSLYVSPVMQRKGVGFSLLAALVASSEQEGLWTLQAGIFPENTASIALHKRLGFRVIGVRERIGCMNGRWRDVALLERRSSTVGV